MSRYDGLIIPRSYSEYINKTDAATLLQALQLSGVMDNAPTADSVHPVKSGGIHTAIEAKNPVDTVALNNMNSVTSNAVANSFGTWETLWSGNSSIIRGIICNEKAIVTIHLQGFVCSSNDHLITTIAEKYRPRTVSRGFCFSAENPILMGYINVETDGKTKINGMNGKTVYGDSIIIIEKDV